MSAKNSKAGLFTVLGLVAVVAAGGAFYVYKQNSGGSAGYDSVVVAAQETGGTDAQQESASGESGPVVAIVDGTNVTRADIDRYIQSMPNNVRQIPPQALYPMALEQVISARLVQNRADQASLANDPEVLQQLDEVRQQIIRNVYIQRTVDAQISDDKLKSAYNDYVKAQGDVEERHARHILVDSEEKAKELIAKLDDGAEFSVLAKENSIGPTAPKGGDLGWFAKGDMVPEFDVAAFSLKKGAYSQKPVKTQFGWHVIQIEDARKRPAPSFEEVKPMLQAQLRREVLEGLLGKWREVADIQTFDMNGNPIEPAAGGETAAPAPEDAPADEKAPAEKTE